MTRPAAPRLYLASGSPRRRELLTQLGLAHEVLRVPAPPGEDGAGATGGRDDGVTLAGSDGRDDELGSGGSGSSPLASDGANTSPSSVMSPSPAASERRATTSTTRR